MNSPLLSISLLQSEKTEITLKTWQFFENLEADILRECKGKASLQRFLRVRYFVLSYMN